MNIEYKYGHTYQVIENGIVLFEGTWKECQKYMKKNAKDQKK